MVMKMGVGGTDNWLWSLQACRGTGLDDGVEVDSANDTRECSVSQYLSVPMDTAVMYATPPGKHQRERL